MRIPPVIWCSWPGLPGLWLRGDWISLAAAILFGFAVHFLLVCSFVWCELVPLPVILLSWATLLTVWGCSAYRSFRSIHEFCGNEGVDDGGLFVQAQGEYLRGHWYEAESLLRKLLRKSPGDIEAHLLLATLYRHTRRGDEMRDRLRRLERLDGAQQWRWEVDRERQLLQRKVEGAVTNGGADSRSQGLGTEEAVSAKEHRED